MATLDQQVFVFTVILCILIELGNCLQCYSCNSGPDDFCDDSFSYNAQITVPLITCENSPYLADLPGAGPNTHCGKTKKRGRGNHPNDYVFRGCVPENYCRLVKSEVGECELCDQNRCNSSSGLIPSCILGIITLLVVKFNL